VVAGDFGQQFVGGNANGGGQLALGQNPLFHMPRQRHGLEQGCVRVLRLADGRHVEIRFVNGHGFYDRAGFGDNLHDVP
jgi:hypothetical protein